MSFDPEKLNVYKLALRFVVLADDTSRSVPSGIERRTYDYEGSKSRRNPFGFSLNCRSWVNPQPMNSGLPSDEDHHASGGEGILSLLLQLDFLPGLVNVLGRWQ